MSVQAIGKAFEAVGLSPSEKLLLLALSNYAGPKMTCFPSHSTLSADTGMSERNILRLFKALEQRGLVSRRVQKRGNKSRTTDLVTLHFDGDTMSPRRAKVGDTMSGGVGTNASKGGDTVSPPEPLEPSILTSRTREPNGKGSPSALGEDREPSGRIAAAEARALFADLAASIGRKRVSA